MRPLTILAIVAIIAVPVFTFYDLNGHSFDITDRQILLVVSDSMDGDVHEYAIDSFQADTLVMIEHIPEHEKPFLREGQVISFYDGDILVQHRIVGVNSDSVYALGDNGHSTDRVYFEDINGVVIGTNSWLGKIIAFIEGNFMLFLGMMFALCCALVILAMYPIHPVKEVD